MLAKLDQRLTAYERNTNLQKFIFSTPFTKGCGGSSRGSIENQYNKKTILTTDHHFPYIKTRIKIQEKTEVILTPIEVAIEDMVIKLTKLDSAMANDRLTLLQMELQSCVATVVMAGPMEVAKTFLRLKTEALHSFTFDQKYNFSNVSRNDNLSKYPAEHVSKLKLCFHELCTKCGEALRYNRKHLKEGQEQYHKHLQNRYRQAEICYFYHILSKHFSYGQFVRDLQLLTQV